MAPRVKARGVFLGVRRGLTLEEEVAKECEPGPFDS